jgi:DMSO/TMAO reductase YedYZ molybdopterin-dependent catalytic subunit
VLFSVMVGASILFGILHSTGALHSLGMVTSMQVHVAAAVAAAPFALWHVLARRVRPRRTDLTRRTVVRAGAVMGGAALAYGVLEVLPGGRRRVTGSFERGSYRPDFMPVTQWLNDRVPPVDRAKWRLSVSSGDRRRDWSYDELLRFDDRVRATIDCTGGWYAEQDWSGVRLSRLLPGSPDARSIAVRSVTGYGRRFPAGDVSNLLLATRVGGAPLSPGHGSPLRLVAPGRRGFWWVKWVGSVETSETPWWWQLPFPLS